MIELKSQVSVPSSSRFDLAVNRGVFQPSNSSSSGIVRDSSNF